MKIGPATANDWQGIMNLLDRANLPIADLNDTQLPHFLVARDGAALAGAVAVQPFGSIGLLRSLVVDSAFRGEGVGKILVHTAETLARDSGLSSLILLTTTAAPFFDRLGYARIERDEAPSGVHGSAEFTRLCPSNAICMRKPLA